MIMEIQKKSAAGLIPVMHMRGHNACDNLALFLKEHIYENDRILASNIVWPSGKPAKKGQPMICGSCGHHGMICVLPGSDPRSYILMG